jgi:general secretion pathway protein H
MRRRHARSTGFTLVEATITIAIMALAAAVVVPALGNITRAELRANSSKLAGFIRSTYDSAALNGQTYRMVFDFESRAITVGATEKVLALEPDSNVLAAAAETTNDLDRPGALEEAISAAASELSSSSEDSGKEMDTSAMSAFFAVNKLAGKGDSAADDAFSDTGDALPLAEDVHLLDVWIEGMSEVESEGKAFLYFFPHGYTQDAIVHLEDTDNNVYSVRVQALTGRTSIEAGYVEVKK